MRSVEDVIKAVSICWKLDPGTCWECPYFPEGCHDNAERKDVLAYLGAYRDRPRWVPVECAPEEEGPYLTFCRYRDGSTAQKIKLWKDGAFTSEMKLVTHWMRLPAGPEAEH